MLSLRDTASMQDALSRPIHPMLHCLIRRRMDQLGKHVECDLSELVQFVVVEPGDTLNLIDAEMGFPVLYNLVDGARFGDPEFTPSWEWMQDHGAWFELVFILSDDGYGVIAFVQDDPGVEFDVHALCLHYSGRSTDPTEGGR